MYVTFAKTHEYHLKVVYTVHLELKCTINTGYADVITKYREEFLLDVHYNHGLSSTM